MTLRFGTDGVRGVANAELTPDLVVALGRAASRVLGGPFVVGRDTRISGPMLQACLSAGMAADGSDVCDLGVIPTPGVAWVAARRGCSGAVVSASHNPFPDNGIKLLAPGGMKLSDDAESQLEAEIDRLLRGPDPGRVPPVAERVGRIDASCEAERYLTGLAASLAGRRLDGVRVVLDCANGAASELAPRVFGHLGADVRVIGDQPSGVNINDGCGSTHPDLLMQAVLSAGADVGLAFDGDADRVLAVDHTGALVDGDQIIAVCALDRLARGLLERRSVVVTVMTNLGFRRAMADRGVRLVETDVGDRYVLEAMEAEGLTLGGEQSGHIIFRDLATTGDGMLTGLQLLDVVVRSGRPLAELAGVMTRCPQVLHNVRVADRDALASSGELWRKVGQVESELGERGRVLIRASGTEPVVRVMVEAATRGEAEDVTMRLVAAVERSLGRG